MTKIWNGIVRGTLLAIVLLGIVVVSMGGYHFHLQDFTKEEMRTYAYSELGSIWTSHQLALLSRTHQPFSLETHFEKLGSSIHKANRSSRRYEYPVSQPPTFPGQSPVLVGLHFVEQPDVRFYLLNDGTILEWLPKVREARVMERPHEHLEYKGSVIHVP